MKKIVLVILSIVSILMINSVYAENDVKVQINGEIINFNDTGAQIINDRTMVPFRKIFNVLGISDDNIIWDGETQTIIANNNEKQIKLQIGNNFAEKRVNDKVENITLDSAPVIRNDRTLVPLRFIAESLGKTVAWDSTNRTAVIIDYEYFTNKIKEKSLDLYNFLNLNTANTEVSVIRKYTDVEDNNKNYMSVVTADIQEKNEDNYLHQNVSVSFSGNSELMKEIASEGWSDIKYENNYYDDYFTTKALTEGFKKVYDDDELKFLYTGLKCQGNNTDSIMDLLKNINGIDEKNINIETFNTLKNEFLKFIELFKVNPSGELYTGNITSDQLELSYFDFTKLDNVLHNSPINRVYSLLNTQIFNYDVTLKELCYDYPKMNMNIKTNDSKLEIDFILSNEYNEKVEYNIKISKGELL